MVTFNVDEVNHVVQTSNYFGALLLRWGPDAIRSTKPEDMVQSRLFCELFDLSSFDTSCTPGFREAHIGRRMARFRWLMLVSAATALTRASHATPRKMFFFSTFLFIHNTDDT